MNLGDLEYKADDAEYEIKIDYEGKMAWPETSPIQSLGTKLVQMISIEEANRLLKERLEKAPEIFGWPDNAKDMYYANWGSLNSPKDTHRARLVCIEEVK